MRGLNERPWSRAMLWGIAVLVALGCWLQNGMHGLNPVLAEEVEPVVESIDESSESSIDLALQSAFEQAEQAAALAKVADSADQWDQIVVDWAGAIATLQTIPVQSPERFFIQRQQRDYLTQLARAQQQAEGFSWPDVFPSLGSAILDHQLRLYLSYLATVGGPPDILIVGSSRALQGIDPQQLQQPLADQGYPANVFNFSVNGATAQVMDFVLRQLLTPEQLPKLIIWGDGARAFNSSRNDATFARIVKSPGYQAILAGQKPGFVLEERAISPGTQPSNGINAYGFLPAPKVFAPEMFYQTYPRVAGRYDAFYSPFSLVGIQTQSLRSLVTYLNRNNTDLVYVTLPLSGDYLDGHRRSKNQQFQRFLQTQSQRQGFALIDLLTTWVNQDFYFADPSHLNQAGAAAIAQQLARNPLILNRLEGPE